MRSSLIVLVFVAIYQCSGDETDVNLGSENNYFGGDIVLSYQQRQTYELMVTKPVGDTNDILGDIQNAVIVDLPNYAWTDGIVPYVLDSTVTTHQDTLDAVNAAIADFHSMTCIQFTERTTELDYIRIFKGSGCYSNIGRVGGPQDVSIGFGCESKGIVIHEFLHALGRWHEQSRPDRDQFVTINLANVQDGFENNFDRLDEVFYVSTQGIPYDLGSVMHYNAYGFAVDRRIPTIRPIDSTVPLSALGQRSGFSNRDIAHVHNQYCGGDGGTWGEWGSFSACSRTCNGGERTRTRECIGGTNCLGSNIERAVCNTNSCPEVEAMWSQWSSWSSCSITCGNGQRTRTRQCQNGNTCQGVATEVEACNTQGCPTPSSWGPWGSWSACSRTCAGGGVRSRSRTCQNGNDCPGNNQDQESCNEGVVCPVDPGSGEWGEWSACSVTCGGGVRIRTRLCGANRCNLESESCNERECEDRLQGLISIGCYVVPSSSATLKLLEGTDSEVLDDPFTRTEPIRKCGSASLRADHTVFGVTLGYCISGSSEITDYQTYKLDVCQEGVGRYYSGYFFMDVYSIFNVNNFQDSVEEIVNGTEPTVATDELGDTSGATVYLPSLVLLVGLLIFSFSLLL